MSMLLTAINAKYIHSNLAVYSLKAAAGELSSQVELAEFTINHRTEEILGEIYRRSPEVLLFSCYIWNIEYVKELAAECRKVMPDTPIWLGGPEVSYDAEQFLEQHPEVTGILAGEGEISFRQLTKYYVNQREVAALSELKKVFGFAPGDAIEQIPGAVYRSGISGGSEPLRIRANTSAGLTDLSRIPFPYEGLEEFEHRIIYYESSRGCPFSCSYCLSSIDRSVRFRDLELVKKELQFFLDAKAPQVKFVDRTFNCRHSHAMAIWRYLIEHDNGITNFHFEIAADLLNEEELELMRQMRPGLIQLEIGVQSTNQDTICAIHRKMDLEKVKANVARVHAMGNIHQHLDLIAGLPYEDYDSFGRSFDEVYAMEPEQLQLGFLKVLKGSCMQEEAGRYGIVCREKPPYEVLYSEWLSFFENLRLKAIEEMVEIYYNSLQFRNTLQRLVPGFPSPFRFFEELAEYYREKGLDERNHSRLQRYEILLAFIREKKPEEEEIYRELLTVDLYLRERVKSRPAFAPDLSEFREEIRNLQHDYGKQNHVEVLRAERQDPEYLLFDYSQRNPLTGDALVRGILSHR